MPKCLAIALVALTLAGGLAALSTITATHGPPPSHQDAGPPPAKDPVSARLLPLAD
ncbi:hypothetical protein [Methylosinus sp. RM1]|uniref:hypothetical protein n=1 Tax=Methylosinus sp. RM1 TaxID=2583817 RepID=UPI00140D9FBC|nr:hypothetical protein [Methylosinus sp. RM1]